MVGRIDTRVVRVELGASGLNVELPVDRDAFGASLFEQCQHFLFKPLLCSNSPVQTQARNHTKLALNHIQPACLLRCVDKLKSLCECKRLLGTEVLIKRRSVMRVEVVQHQPYFGRRFVMSGKCLTKVSELVFCSSLIDLAKAHATLGFDRCEQHARAKLLILVMLFGNLTFARCSWYLFVANQETRSFVKADNWKVRVIGLGIHIENVFEPSKKGCSNRTDTPGLFQMRLEFVFFSTSATKECETWSQMPLSTTLSANKRRLQRA